MASPTAFNCCAGITPSVPPLPKQPAVLLAVQGRPEAGLAMVLNRFPLLSVDCEKLPCLSSNEGTRKKLTVPPLEAGCASSDINQNALCPVRPGLPTGPPSVPPQNLVDEYDLGTRFPLFAQVFEFHPECCSISWSDP